MRILVVSDTHGDFFSLKRALDAQPAAEAIIHCGDGSEQFQFIKDVYRDKTVIGVRGNCDWSSKLPPTETVRLGDKTIFITHGHLYQAKFTFANMVYAAREQNADILLFGHTHQAVTDYLDGLYLMNPGSCSGYYATYGTIDITNKGDIVTNIVRLQNR
ncbi:MAG: metallophosphoesterase [Ruminococcus sp.]|nr:metallophosphoesterase [Ruminococcus sp.]